MNLEPVKDEDANNKLTMAMPAQRGVRFGVMEGEITIADDFEDPLADDLQQTFDGFREQRL